jgi:hypothetical protein
MVKVSCGIRALLKTVADWIFYAFRGDSNNATSGGRRLHKRRVRESRVRNQRTKPGRETRAMNVVTIDQSSIPSPVVGPESADAAV